MLCWMCGHTRLDKIKNGYIRQEVQLAREDKMSGSLLRWFGYVLCRLTNAPVCECETE